MENMQKQYSETFVVRPTDCDCFRRMRLDALFVAMQEGGERHALRMGVGYDRMKSLDLFFVLARIHVHIERMPSYGETITHTTWPGTANRFFFPRYHVFTAQDGTVLASAAVLWVLLDSVNRKVVPPAKADLTFPDTSAIEPPLSLPTRQPPLGENPQVFARTPVYSEYDVNCHVNNARYMAWLCDCLGRETLAEYHPYDFVASYEKEIRECDPLTLSLSRDGESFSFFVTSTSGEKHFAAGGLLKKAE